MIVCYGKPRHYAGHKEIDVYRDDNVRMPVLTIRQTVPDGSRWDVYRSYYEARSDSCDRLYHTLKRDFLACNLLLRDAKAFSAKWIEAKEADRGNP